MPVVSLPLPKSDKKGMTKKTLKAKCERALEVVSEIERLTADRKKLYEEHDELVALFRYEKGLEAFGVTLARTFGKGNTQWGHGPVRELVIEKVDGEEK